MEHTRLSTLATPSGLFTTILLVVIAFHTVHGGADTNRATLYQWDLPCAYLTSNGITVPPFTSGLNLREVYNGMAKNVSEVKKKVDALLDKREKTIPYLYMYIDEGQLDGLITLKEYEPNINTLLQDFYQQLSTVAVFLQKVHQDAKAEEPMGDYSKDLQKLEEDNYRLMCSLQWILLFRNVATPELENHEYWESTTDRNEYTRVVTPDVMTASWRNVGLLKDRTLILTRDYYLIRDYGKVLNYIRSWFVTLRNHCWAEATLGLGGPVTWYQRPFRF